MDADQERVDLWQEWLGYCHTPDTAMQKFMMLIGPSRSGKGTLLRMLEHMTGPEQYVGVNWDNLCTKFGREPMMGKSIALLGDARTPNRQQRPAILETLLRITGGDTVSVDQKHITEIGNVRINTRISIAVNELPAFIDNAAALANRMLILDLHNSYAGREDYTIEGKLKAEIVSGGLSNWAIEGLKRLRENGRFTQPESASATQSSFRELTSPITTFVEECCELKMDSEVKKNTLFKIWTGWCREHNYPIGNNVQFGMHLASAFRVRTKRIKEDDGSRPRIYCGIEPCATAAARYLED